MAITVVIALVAAMLLSLTFIPAAVALFRRPARWPRPITPLCAGVRRGYAPALRWTLRYRTGVAWAPRFLQSLDCGGDAARLEFIPSLDEGDLAVQALRMPGTGARKQSVAMQSKWNGHR